MEAPFAAALLRTESASSSEVENLTSSAKQVALAELGAAKSENAKLVVANARAMRAALKFVDDLSTDSIILMQQALLEESAPQYTGCFRDQQVWIGGGNISPHRAQFVPSHHDRVPDLMQDLVEFCTRTDIPALTHQRSRTRSSRRSTHFLMATAEQGEHLYIQCSGARV